MFCGLAWFLPLIAQETEKTHRIQEIIVLGNNPQADNLLSTQVGLTNLNAEEIVKTPTLFGEPDILRTIQSQAGVSGGIEGFSGILVRGGGNDQNLFILHHLPLYNVSHLGGLFSTFNIAATERAKFYKSGFPAQYGGRVSSVTDIKLRESDFEAYHGQASLGLLSGNVFVTGPIIEDYLAFSAAIRRSWSELITIPALALINKSKKDEGTKKIFGYSFMDANVKFDYRFSDMLTGFTHLYYGSDAVKTGDEEFSTMEANTYEEQSLWKLKWGNAGAATGLAWHPNDVVLASANAYYVKYESDFKTTDDEETDDGSMYSHKSNQNSIADIGVSLEGSLNLDDVAVLKLGGNYVSHRYSPEKVTIESSTQDESFLPTDNAPDIKAKELSVWTDNTLSLSDWLSFSLGARWDKWSSEGRNFSHLEPRASMRLTFNDMVSLKGSYSRTHQYVQQVSNSYIDLPTDAWLPTGTKFKPLESDQIAVGIYGNLAEGCFFSVEGYYKWMRNLLEYKEGVYTFSPSVSWEDKLTQGEGWAYGTDISLNKVKGRLTGSIGYGLMWNYRQFDELNGGARFPAKYDNRHKLNIKGQYMLTDKVELNFAWTYVTGNRVTLALQNYQKLNDAGFTDDLAPLGLEGVKWGTDYYSQRNNVRLPAYHRLDIGVSITTKYDNDMTGIWSFGLYNAYCRFNPVALTKKGIEVMYGEEAWSTKYQTYGLLPVIPSISYTLKF